MGARAQEATWMLRGSVTNLSSLAVSHADVDHVLMVWLLLERAHRIIGTLWGPAIKICLCAHVAVNVWRVRPAAAELANDTVASPDLFVCLGVGGAQDRCRNPPQNRLPVSNRLIRC